MIKSSVQAYGLRWWRLCRESDCQSWKLDKETILQSKNNQKHAAGPSQDFGLTCSP